MEKTVTTQKTQLFAIPVSIIMVVAMAVVPDLFNDKNIVRNGWDTFFDFPSVIFTILGGLVLHEGFHILGFVLTGANVRGTKVGIQWKTFTPYVHNPNFTLAWQHRFATVLPLIVLGIIPYIAGIIIGNAWIVWFGIVFTVGAVGDVLILFLMKDLRKIEYVKDHPSKIGILVD